MKVIDYINNYRATKLKFCYAMKQDASKSLIQKFCDKYATDLQYELEKLKDKYIANEFSSNFEMNAKEYIQSYSNNKDNAIEVFKHLIEHMENDLHVSIDFNPPKIKISNTFERLMFESKELQQGRRIAELSKLLWTDERTIQKDIAKLQGDDPIQIMGKPLIIEELESCKRIYSSRTTVHPLFLTYNLTQVFVTLRGLYLMSLNSGNKIYAELSAKDIYNQLTDYAQNRIIKCLKELFAADKKEIDWFENLKNDQGSAFYNERECSRMGNNQFIEIIKNGEPAYVECKNKIYFGVKMKLVGNNKVQLTDKNDNISIIDEDDIVNCSITKEELIKD